MQERRAILLMPYGEERQYVSHKTFYIRWLRESTSVWHPHCH